MRQIKSLVLDLALIALATFLAMLLRDNLELSQLRLSALVPYLVYTLLCAAVILPASGITRTLWRFSGMYDYWRLVLVCGVIVLSAVASTFAFSRMDNVARSIPILQFLLIVSFLLALRGAMRTHRFRHGRATTMSPGKARETVLVVGLNSVAELFLQATAEHAADRIGIAGVLGRNDRQIGQTFRRYPILGVPEDVAGVLDDLEVHGISVDRIVVAIGFHQLSPVAQQALLNVENGSHIKIDYFAERVGFGDREAPTRVAAPRDMGSANAPIGTADVFALREALRRPYWRLKRCLDVMLGLSAILLTLPLMVLLALAVAITHGLPIVFWQQRPGRNGRPFKVYKFRSLLGAHDENGRRLTNPERLTYFGRLLRASRFDELPQLFSVVCGDMSIVGPRPLLDVDQIDAFRDRLRVRPGLTGWAQVNGGTTLSAADKMALDIWYIHNASFRLDCWIVLLTVRMLLLGERYNSKAVTRAWAEIGRPRHPAMQTSQAGAQVTTLAPAR